ncbi:MAG: acyl-ACP--UDP-N-acetylglucosamine O-acyltransferase [Weeksellaceae bacterium]
MTQRPLAYIHPGAKIADSVKIEPFSVIYDDVEIGEGTWIGPNVTIMEGTRIGKNCKIFPGAVIAAEPQDLKYEGEKTYVYIGDNTTIRESVTINKGTKALGYTKIGNNCLIMATAHVAHDCILGDHVIVVNGVGLAGHIEIGDYGFVGGMSAIHQFTRVGAHSFIAGGSLVRKDIPPYVKVGRDPLAYKGVNSLGLVRRGFSNDVITEIQNIYRVLFQMNKNVSQAILAIETEFQPSQERDMILDFLKNSPRGIIKSSNNSKED